MKGVHTLNTAKKIGLVTLLVQQLSMKVEMKQKNSHFQLKITDLFMLTGF